MKELTERLKHASNELTGVSILSRSVKELSKNCESIGSYGSTRSSSVTLLRSKLSIPIITSAIGVVLVFMRRSTTAVASGSMKITTSIPVRLVNSVIASSGTWKSLGVKSRRGRA